jgi:hypothetical protein
MHNGLRLVALPEQSTAVKAAELPVLFCDSAASEAQKREQYFVLF